MQIIFDRKEKANMKNKKFQKIEFFFENDLHTFFIFFHTN